MARIRIRGLPEFTAADRKIWHVRGTWWLPARGPQVGFRPGAANAVHHLTVAVRLPGRPR